MKPKFDLENEGQGHKSDTFRNQEKVTYFSEKKIFPHQLENLSNFEIGTPLNFWKIPNFLQKGTLEDRQEKTAKFEENPSGSSLNHEASIFKKNLNFAPERGAFGLRSKFFTLSCSHIDFLLIVPNLAPKC